MSKKEADKQSASPTQNDAASSQKPAKGPKIRLRLQDQQGNSLEILVNRQTNWKKVRTAFEKSTKMEEGSSRLTYEGKRLEDNQTVIDSVSVDDIDDDEALQIDVMKHQDGGGGGTIILT